MLTFMNSKLPDKLVVLTSKTTFCKKVNPMKYPLQTHTYIGEDLEFIIHIFYWCIPLDHEIYTKCRKKHLTWLKLYLVTLKSLIYIPPGLLIFRKFSTQNILISHPVVIKFWKMFEPEHLWISTVTKNPFNISPKIFRHRLSFVRISEVIAL